MANSTPINNITFNQSNVLAECSRTNEEVYCGLLEHRASKFIIMTASAILIILNMGLLLGLIWYERYGSDNRRTLMNKLFSSLCWVGIAHDLHSVLDFLRYLFGPNFSTLCAIQNFLKVTATSMFLLFYDSILLTKYVLVFKLKNPGAVNDDFWCRFINVWVCSASLLYDGTRYVLPGKMNFSYYICSGTSPSSDMELPKRGGSLVENSSLILYLAVLFRILIHKKGQQGIPARRSATSRFRIEDLVNVEANTIAKVTSNFIIISLFAVYIYFYGKLKTMHHQEYNFYPNYLFIYFHMLLWTPFHIFISLALFYARHQNLRETLLRELNNFFTPG